MELVVVEYMRLYSPNGGDIYTLCVSVFGCLQKNLCIDNIIIYLLLYCLQTPRTMRRTIMKWNRVGITKGILITLLILVSCQYLVNVLIYKTPLLTLNGLENSLKAIMNQSNESTTLRQLFATRVNPLRPERCPYISPKLSKWLMYSWDLHYYKCRYVWLMTPSQDDRATCLVSEKI